jgi:3,4-dihydroxy 2-butanone 4-phosphate synthase
MSAVIFPTTLSEISDNTFVSRFERALDDMRCGIPVVLVDNADREDEGDLIVAAEKINTSSMAMLIRECSGIVCLCLTDEVAGKLELPLMVSDNQSRFQTAFTVTIEARHGVTTGVSAADRVVTIHAAIADNACPEDLARPGHVFPLRAAKGGLLTRPGHTEGSVELAHLAGLKPAAVLSELINPDGTMMKGDEINRFAHLHHLTILTIAELVCHLRSELRFS